MMSVVRENVGDKRKKKQQEHRKPSYKIKENKSNGQNYGVSAFR